MNTTVFEEAAWNAFVLRLRPLPQQYIGEVPNYCDQGKAQHTKC